MRPWKELQGRQERPGCLEAAGRLYGPCPQPVPHVCNMPGQGGPCTVTLPGWEKERPGLGTTILPAPRVLARAQRPWASDQAKWVVTSVPRTDHFSPSAYFELLHQKLRLHFPSRVGCPVLAVAPGSGALFAPATSSREVGACERSFGTREGPKYGKTAVSDYLFCKIHEAHRKLTSWVNGCVARGSWMGMWEEEK